MGRTWKELRLVTTNKMKWEVLELNGAAAAKRNPEGNLTTWDHPLIDPFANFLLRHLRPGNYLDIGAPMAAPYWHIDIIRGDIHWNALDPIRGDLPIEMYDHHSVRYDGAVCATSIAHFYDLRKATMAIRKIVKPFGILIVWESHDCYWNRFKHWVKLQLNRRYDFIQGHWYYVPPGCQDAFHVRQYSANRLRRHFRNNGFALLEEQIHGTSYFQAYQGQ